MLQWDKNNSVAYKLGHLLIFFEFVIEKVVLLPPILENSLFG